jgi:MFS family permease
LAVAVADAPSVHRPKFEVIMHSTNTWNERFVALSGSLILLIGFGAVYSMGALFPRIEADLGIPAWHLAVFFSATGFVYFGFGAVSGALADRFGARSVIRVGQTVLAIGLAMASTASTEPGFAVAYIAGVGIGVGLTYVPVTSGVQALCVGQGTSAAGIVATGIGVGSMLLPPAAAWVAAVFDWRMAMRAMAAVALLGPIIATPLRDPATVLGSAARSFRVSKEFVTLYVAQLLAAVVAFVPFAHLIGVALNRGLSFSNGVALIGGVSLGSIAGRVVTGAIAARIGIYRTASMCSAVMAVAMMVLAASHETWMMHASMAAFGAGYGGFNALLAPITVATSGRAAIGRAVGILATSRALGMLLGPSLVGIGASRFGGYTPPLLFCSCFALTSALLLAMLAVGRRAVFAQRPA